MSRSLWQRLEDLAAAARGGWPDAVLNALLVVVGVLVVLLFMAEMVR